MFKLLHALAVAAFIALPSAQVAAQPGATDVQAADTLAETSATSAPAALISLTDWHESDVLSAVVPDEAELEGDEEEPPADSYTVSRAHGETLPVHAGIEHQLAPEAVWVAPHVSSGAPRGPPCD